MTAKLELRQLYKFFGANNSVLAGVNLETTPGEFLVLVGPSGCGKTTLLRIIAGLDTPSQGRLLLNGLDVTDWEPAKREVAMVFQDYALYPHMNVKQNFEFALKVAKIPKGEREVRIGQTAQMLGLVDMLDRRPSQLSGGQRQRVAIGRALVRQPRLFLLDEPLSNLDAQLRTQMRIELAALHRRLGTTTIYVTHDQCEAMTLADRIVVLNHGVIQQVGTPLELYQRPGNRFVASFIGSPRMNFFEGNLRRGDGESVFETANIQLKIANKLIPKCDGPMTMGLRPEHLKIHEKGELTGELLLVEALGHENHVVAKVGSFEMIARSAETGTMRVGESIRFNVLREAIHWFDATGARQ